MTRLITIIDRPYNMKIPYVTREQMIRLERIMIEEKGISVRTLMDTAGKRLSEHIIKNHPGFDKVIFVCGKGNNGGDGISAAIDLHEKGYFPKIYLMSREMSEASRYLLDKAEELGIEIFRGRRRLNMEVRDGIVVDCLFGYNLNREPEDEYMKLIGLMNQAKILISCDMPSGVDADNGILYENYVDCDEIVFMGLPKIGCIDFDAKKFVADIGIPKDTYPDIGIPEEDYFEGRKIIMI